MKIVSGKDRTQREIESKEWKEKCDGVKKREKNEIIMLYGIKNKIMKGKEEREKTDMWSRSESRERNVKEKKCESRHSWFFKISIFVYLKTRKVIPIELISMALRPFLWVWRFNFQCKYKISHDPDFVSVFMRAEVSFTM